MPIGTIPSNLELEDVLEHIDETIIIADLQNTIVWLNSAALKTLGPLFSLYGVENNAEVIGMHMNFFHSIPSHQSRIMKELDSTHRTVISIKNLYVAETVITPIYDNGKNKQGYLLMLLDVTEKAQQEREKEKTIELLSTPILKIWDSILAIPLIGNLTNDRADKLAETILRKCVEERAEYFLLDLSSLSKMDEASGFHINKIYKALELIGTQCYIVGVSPSLAQSISLSHYKWKTFTHVQHAIKDIINQKGLVLKPVRD
ncbi:STAS domain-containing protein [Bacillus sp. V59.32b]|uniref:STAS domain-containing protein n=1 Tax=Bacillus sp. V59.32b TaxID=1758642 RepID=UPI000E3D56D6|nr:STAS domain-containing protein [Bacillus sp. V59.32b]RFU61734.1 STAS domain-containing protein [Bacillus sp. V59.32b]